MYWNKILAYHKAAFYEPAQRAGVGGRGVLWVKADNKASYKSEHFSFHHTLKRHIHLLRYAQTQAKRLSLQA